MGLEDEDGTVASLSVACVAPEALTSSSYKLLQYKTETSESNREIMKQSTLLDALKSLLGSGVITQSEYVSMQRMVERDDDLMDAAYEAYEMDEDAEDLLDTLARIGKIYNEDATHDNVDDDIGELSEAQKNNCVRY